MEILVSVIRFLHIITVVFMAAPLYNLIVVNERAALGPSIIYKVDVYFENILRSNSRRCFIFQITALATGIALAYLYGFGFKSFVTNWVLMAKTILLLVLTGLLSYVSFGIQPKIDTLLAKVTDDPVPQEIASKIRPLRVRRKRLASVCLFFVITIVLLGLQIAMRYNPILTALLIVMAALFSWRVYRSGVPYGWI